MSGRRPIEDWEEAPLAALGAAVREARLAAGLTAEELAERAEYTGRSVFRIEAGAMRTRASTLARLSAGLVGDADRAQALVDEWLSIAGDAIAPESAHPERVERRRAGRTGRKQRRKELVQRDVEREVDRQMAEFDAIWLSEGWCPTCGRGADWRPPA